MSSRRSSRSLAANPLLIGAVTTLVTIVAVFLAYNANNGLPFTPTYDLTVRLPDAASLVVGNDVRIGGTRVGLISKLTPIQNPAGGATSGPCGQNGVCAAVSIKLQKSAGPLPIDTTVIVRARSTLGEKYLQLTPGRSPIKVPSGGTLSIANARPAPVEIDQVLNMFDAPTRAAQQVNLTTFGNALAGRGGNLNNTIGNLRPLVTNLVPVMGLLSAPSTRLANLFPALERAASQVVPVAQQQAQLFVDMDTTFAALASVARPFLQQSIVGSPPALQQAITSLPVIRPFLAQSADFLNVLAPSAVALRAAAPALAGALSAGAANLGPAVELNRRLSTTLKSVADFATDPGVQNGITHLTTTAQSAIPIVSDLKGAQLNCNYVTLFFRNIASLLSEGDSVGAWSRFMVIIPPTGPNNEGVPSSAPANGPGLDNHLHVTPYPYAAAPGQPKECVAGNQVYQAGKTVIGNPPVSSATAHDQTTRTGVGG
jgi:phospholipid/cholesterol/gamma-HCH transport system substrate-binding protein